MWLGTDIGGGWWYGVFGCVGLWWCGVMFCGGVGGSVQEREAHTTDVFVTVEFGRMHD